MKKLLSLLLVVLMVLTLGACSSKGGDSATDSSTGSVYYLNFKPEQDEAWKALAATYTAETGVPVQVVTAASGTYEETLMSEIGKTSAPTLFQVNGPVGLANWSDYCLDLSGTELYNNLVSKDFALMNGSEVAGIAYVIESYGLICNKTLLAEAGYTVEDIVDFASLKAVVEDITARSDELGFAAFTSAGMDSSSDWRFKTHLANLPLYFEYLADGVGTKEAISGAYLDNYRAIWDLYINNSTCSPVELSGKTGNDTLAEFVSSEAVFYQNGSWAYGDVSSTFADEELQMIPIYIGAGNEANQGLCTGTENYWCVNKEASEADVQATLDFLAWCVTSEEGTNAMANDMGFVIPFKNAVQSKNLFVKQDNEYTAAGKTPVSWNFPTMPSESWKNEVGTALTMYAADQTDDNWAKVVTAFVDGWAAEYAMK